MPLFALLLASQLLIPVADRAPRLDYEPGCRAVIGDGVGTLQACEEDEKSAREQVTKEWDQFSGSDQEMCTGMTQNYHPSYVELLSCLEMGRDARMSPDDESQATMGMGDSPERSGIRAHKGGVQALKPVPKPKASASEPKSSVSNSSR